MSGVPVTVFTFAFSPQALACYPITANQVMSAELRLETMVNNKIGHFQFLMTSISTNFDGTKTYPGEICPFFTVILRSWFFQ